MRRRIEELKQKERTIREERQALESRLRRIVWRRLMKRAEALETAPGQHT